MNRPRTLLDRAKSVPTKRLHDRFYTEECAITALAWVRGEVLLTQIGNAMGVKPNNYHAVAYQLVAQGLMYAIHHGMVTEADLLGDE